MAAYNGWMGEYNVPNIAPQLSQMVEASDTVRTNMQNRAVGEAAATGKLSDAANVAFKQGNVKTGLALKDMNDEQREKIRGILGKAALNVKTPEEWEQVRKVTAKYFPNEEMETWEEVEGLRASSRDYYKDRDDARADRAEGRANRSLALQEDAAETGKWEMKTVKQPDGSEALVRVNVKTGELKPLGDGTSTAAPAGPANPYYDGKFTVEQGKVAGYADRIGEAEDIISANESAGLSRMEQAKANVPVVGNSLVSPGYQKLEQAQRNFINAVLRRESGAVISPEEFDNAKKQYFPQPGDDKDTLAQKAQNRKTAFESFARESGPNYKPKAKAKSDDGWQDLGNGVRIREKK